MPRKNKQQNSIYNFDALTDVVSNNVGIFVLLASALSLFMVINHTNEMTVQKEDLPQNKVHQVLIPWTRPSQKSPILFVLEKQNLTYFDRKTVLQNLSKILEQTPDTNKRKFTLNFEKYQVQYSIYSQSTQCFLFIPQRHQSKKNRYIEKQVMQVMKEKEAKSFYAFFWVDSQSLEMFRELRQYLWDNKIQVGWKPIDDKSEMRYCVGANNGIGFRPQ